MALLEVRDVTLRFGGIVALEGVSFDVEEGHISGLIGPNGAGKTTAFNVITRLYKPDSGEVLLDGSSILTVLPEALRTFDQQFPGLRMVIYALLLVLLMIFRPQGLLGRREIGWGWIRFPTRTRVPVALADATDAKAHTGKRPIDRRSTLGESDTNE